MDQVGGSLNVAGDYSGAVLSHSGHQADTTVRKLFSGELSPNLITTIIDFIVIPIIALITEITYLVVNCHPIQLEITIFIHIEVIVISIEHSYHIHITYLVVNCQPT